MFPLLFVAAILMAGAAAGTKRKKKGPASAGNFAVVRTTAEYQALVQRGVFRKPTVAVIVIQQGTEIVSLLRQAAAQMPSVFFLAAIGDESKVLLAEWIKPEDIAFTYKFTSAELVGTDPLTQAQVPKEDDGVIDVWVSTTIPIFIEDLAEATATALGHAVPEPPQPKPDEKLDVTNKWSPFSNLKKMQESLIALGFDVGSKGADGKWGSGTKGGVSAFQQYVNDEFEMDLREDGEPDAPTRTAVSVGIDLATIDQWIFPGEEPPEQPQAQQGPEPDQGQWQPEDWDEITWSDKLFVAPDCSRVVKGMFWSSQRLNPRIIEAAKGGGAVFAEDILDDELAKDSPFCLDGGYDNWGPDMQGWYDDWVDLIYQDLELYAEHPELIGEY